MLDVLIITGASRGIGKAVLEASSDITKSIVAIGSSSDIYQANNSNESKITTLKLDLSKIEAVKGGLECAIQNYAGKNVGVVLCASQLGEYGGIFSNPNYEEWNHLYRCNVLGNLSVVSSLINKANGKKFKSIKIIFFAGGGAAYAYPDFFGYSLTKVSTVRAVENLHEEFKKLKWDASVVALAPGAVQTDMLKKVQANGGLVKTKTDISEPVEFVRKFMSNSLPHKFMSGRFVHVRDEWNTEAVEKMSESHMKLRRVE